MVFRCEVSGPVIACESVHWQVQSCWRSSSMPNLPCPLNNCKVVFLCHEYHLICPLLPLLSLIQPPHPSSPAPLFTLGRFFSELPRCFWSLVPPSACFVPGCFTWRAPLVGRLTRVSYWTLNLMSPHQPISPVPCLRFIKLLHFAPASLFCTSSWTLSASLSLHIILDPQPTISPLICHHLCQC